MIFVNMYRLGSILQISGRVKEAKNFKDFATGFIQAKEHLYFIDVGDGKEMVDSRIRGFIYTEPKSRLNQANMISGIELAFTELQLPEGCSWSLAR